MSLSTHLDKIEAALRGRDPPDEPRLVYRLHECVEGCPIALEEWESESIPQLKANAPGASLVIAHWQFVWWKRSPDRDDNLSNCHRLCGPRALARGITQNRNQ